MATMGVPIKLIHESTGHVISVEMKNNNVYRGKLIEAEDTLNLQLRDVIMTAHDGRVTQLDQIYIRGSQIRFFVVPDILRAAPMFKRMGQPNTGLGKGDADGGRPHS